MPRLRDSPEAMQDKLFAGIVAKNRIICGFKDDIQLAMALCINIRTFRYKMHDPDRFSRKELRQLFRLLKFSEEEKSQVM